MHPSLDPSCPRCANTNVALFSDRLIYALADLTRERPVAKIMVFKCPCGLAFTHEEKVREEVAVV